jgi:hypothetical protein
MRHKKPNVSEELPASGKLLSMIISSAVTGSVTQDLNPHVTNKLPLLLFLHVLQ